MCPHPFLCPSLCPGRLTTLDFIFRLPCLLTSGRVELTCTSHWQQIGGREKNEIRVLFPVCLVRADWLCSSTENLNQQPSPIATDSSPCPFRPVGGDCSVSPSLVPFLNPAYTFVNIPFTKFFLIT